MDYLVARLVAFTFCEGYFEGATVNHINGNPLDNRAENLEWVTRAENIRKAFEAGLYSSSKKVRLEDSEGGYIDFESLSAGSAYLGRTNGYLSNAIKKGRKVCSDKYGEFYTIMGIGHLTRVMATLCRTQCTLSTRLNNTLLLMQ